MRTSFRTWLAVAVVLLIGAVGAWAQRPVFNPQGDYAYELAETDARVIAIEIGGDGFALPAPMPEADTAFLELEVESTTGAEPVLTVERGGIEVRQSFEPNSRGRRFVDVSPLIGAAGDQVRLASDSVVWKAGASRLFFYSNAPLDGRRVLVLAPHPDDAEIAAFGVYRRTNADVITVTSGDAGPANFKVLWEDRGEHFRVKGWIRTWDSISVPFFGGVYPGKARNLGYYDALLRRMHGAPDEPVPPLVAVLDDPAYYRRLNVDEELRNRPFVGSWRGLVDDLVWELERVRPGVIVTPHPFLDNHPDHRFTTIALIDALEKWGGDCELYLYTNHALENEAWPLGDRNAMSGLPAWSGQPLSFRRLYSHPLTADEQKLKLVALEAMHDLREFDLHEHPPAATSEEDYRRRWRYDYFRRGPRPNELFFVIGRDDAFALREAFLASPASKPPPPKSP